MAAIPDMAYAQNHSSNGSYIGHQSDFTLKESKITVKVPKKLRTLHPFWGVPVPDDPMIKETEEEFEDFVTYRKDTLSIPQWVAWNLDLADTTRYKYEKVLPSGAISENVKKQLRFIVNECHRWAWRKPYGMTSVAFGPMYHPKGGDQPYAWYVAVCKRETQKNMFALGYSSIAFMVSNRDQEKVKVYDYSTSVNIIEAHIGYNIFPKLPDNIQELIEGQTTYELFCSYQEQDDALVEFLEVEFEHEFEYLEQD